MKKSAPPLERSPEALELVAQRFRALGDPVRLRLLHSLREGERSVGDLAERLKTTQPNVSKHLRRLQDLGFVTRRQQKNTVYYALADDSVFELCDIACAPLHERLSAQAAALAPSRTRRR